MARYEMKFQPLTPSTDVDLTVYDDALRFVFDNDDLLNVAISGPYGAGKSSIIETYKKNSFRRFLHISLANFEVNDNDEKIQIEAMKKGDESKSSDNAPAETILEGKILNQLIHQIPPNKIPQTNFRIKRTVKIRQLVLWALCILVFALSALHIAFNDSWKIVVDGLAVNWLKGVLLFTTSFGATLLSGLICLSLLGVLIFNALRLQLHRGLFKKVNTNKLSIEIFEGSDESYFDK